MVEVKNSNRIVDPFAKHSGSLEGESAYEQICRYVYSERTRIQNADVSKEETKDTSWLGAVTDGHLWWLWEWGGYSEVPKRIHPGEDKPFTFSRNDQEQFENQILHRFDRIVGKQWAPKNPTSLFQPMLDELEIIFGRAADRIDTKTQKKLWRRQLEVSGNAPSDEDSSKLFLLHTFLIVVARSIASALRGSNEIPTDGFVSWASREKSWYSEIATTVQLYDWKVRPGDLLRPLFNSLCDQKHRKIYGEYYTPDWIAEGMVSETLDEEWISKQCENWNHIKSGSGVLDPACGSGTFLYHCARHIANSEFVQKQHMQQSDLTDFIAGLIYGIDIHPVAVEMAKTTVARALPDVPRISLNIFQGDSLRVASKSIYGDEVAFESTKQKFFSLTKPVYSDPNFPKFCESIVRAAEAKNELPLNLLATYAENSHDQLKEFHRALTEIIDDEGDGVWSSYINNQIAIISLQNRKVDRIISNPPWVRISNIQSKQRKSEIIQLAKASDIWQGRNVATSFDIASLFATLCPSIYLSDNNASMSTWLLPQSALKGTNWKKFRDLRSKSIARKWDLSNYPFPQQSNACVLFERDLHTNNSKSETYQLLHDGAIPDHCSWDDVQSSSKWKKVKTYRTQPATAWFSEGEPLARQGATITPNSLLVVDSKSFDYKNNVFTVITGRSRHGNWKRFNNLTVQQVPKRWICKTIFASNLLPFCIDGTTECIIPITKNGNKMELDENALKAKCWKELSAIYASHAGSGSATPQTLIDQIDERKKLSSQIKSSYPSVIYNTSGAHLRASRNESNRIVNSDCYRVPVKSDEEGLFLCAMLNATVLKERLAQTRRSDRHFHKHFWSEIPIPRFDSKISVHRELCEWSKKAEAEAQSTLIELTSLSIEKKRREMRLALESSEVMSKINKFVYELLPEFAKS